MFLAEAKKELDGIIKKIDINMVKFDRKFPCIARDGVYSGRLSGDGDWTGSFWTGMVILAWKITEDRKYLEYLERYYPVYCEKLNGYTDHDLGFLYQLYSVAMYRATEDEKYYSLSVRAAEMLYARYNAKGQFIRAWGNLDDDYRSGKSIIDCMMNLPFLYAVTDLTQDKKFENAAKAHAESALKNNIRADYSSYHTFDCDPVTGEPIGGFNEGGYSDESCWSRGEAWGIYGFWLTYLRTGSSQYRDAAINMFDYFTSNLRDDCIPYWDFKLPSYEADTPIDTSAALITACAALEMSKTNDGERFKDTAERILQSIMSGYSNVNNPNREGLAEKSFGNSEDGYLQECMIWGDYFYMEALAKVLGYETDMWN